MHPPSELRFGEAEALKHACMNLSVLQPVPLVFKLTSLVDTFKRLHLLAAIHIRNGKDTFAYE